MVNQGTKVGLPQDVGSPSFDIMTTISGATTFWNSLSGLSAVRFSQISTPGSITLGGTTNVAASANIGSPALRQCLIQAGSIVTTAGSVATFPFGTTFSNANWKIAFQTSGLQGSVGLGSTAVITARNASGCDILGGASLTYDYIAVGQI